MNDEHNEQTNKVIINIKKAIKLLTIVFFFFCIVNNMYFCRKFPIMVKEKEHFIMMRKAERAALKESMQLTDATMSDALNYKRHSILARRIRVASVNFYNGIFF